MPGPHHEQEAPKRLQDRNTPSTGLTDLHTFENDIQTAIERVLPPRSPKYTSVTALCIRWEGYDDDAAEMQDELMELFRDVYHYNTETHIIKSIPKSDQEPEMRRWLSQMADMYGRDEDSLYIVLYSGRSTCARWRHETVHLFGGVDKNSIPCTSYLAFDSYASDAGLYASAAHKLLIFDCDVGSNSWHNSEAIVAGPRGIYKTSRSTSRGSIGGNGSFLRGLIDDLKDINGTSTSAASIVARMTRDIFNPTPRTRIGKIAPPTHHFDDSGVATITLQPQISDFPSQQHASPSSPRQFEPRNDSHFQALISVQFAKDARIDEYTLRQTARIQSGLYGPNLQIDVAGFFAKSTGLFAQFTVPYELLLGLDQDCGAYRFIEDVESANTLITNWH